MDINWEHMMKMWTFWLWIITEKASKWWITFIWFNFMVCYNEFMLSVWLFYTCIIAAYVYNRRKSDKFKLLQYLKMFVDVLLLFTSKLSLFISVDSNCGTLRFCTCHWFIYLLLVFVQDHSLWFLNAKFSIFNVHI